MTDAEVIELIQAYLKAKKELQESKEEIKRLYEIIERLRRC